MQEFDQLKKTRVYHRHLPIPEHLFRRFFSMKSKIMISLIFIIAFSTNLLLGNEAEGKATGQPMKKYVTEQATFVL